MEGLIANRVTPIIKCMVLFLFIFTAKVLTSKPQESHEKNSIQHVKPSYYVRTFTKYHHRRTIQWNHDDWPANEATKASEKRITGDTSFIEDDQKIIKKRSLQEYWPSDVDEKSLDVPNLNLFVDTPNAMFQTDQLSPNSHRDNMDLENAKKESKNKNVSSMKRFKVKQAVIPTEATTTMGPTISCFYKIHERVSISDTPVIDDKNAQVVVENDNFERGVLSETTLPNGDTVQTEKCAHTQASCYTLWQQNDGGNITILGQGCWRSSQSKKRQICDQCTRVGPLLPATKFCCCTKELCNNDFLTLKEEVTVTAESTMNASVPSLVTTNIGAGATLALIIMLVISLALSKLYCKRRTEKDSSSDESDVEKGDVMGSGPDALATGLSCVDNLTLIEHIGQGKFGSVWRGSLGTAPVAVKLYSNSNTWQREATIYGLPQLAHPNILKYYGSDSRSSLTSSGRSYLIVVELCASTLRARLQRDTLDWIQFAHIAHGLAAALAHLHTPCGNKPCIVHRDVNSNNVLLTASGDVRLADLGLAQTLHSARDRTTPTRITEAGTLRYLAPEALEGALDLSGALAALCAVDVFSLALVLWEALVRCTGAYSTGSTPPYSQPYADLLPENPTLANMQKLVSRDKQRPPLPQGPVAQWRALKIATDTCDECWDHDAEARLTAVCVEERMSELKQMLAAHGPLIHENNLHPNTQADINPSPPEIDKNSNCDVTTPLLYPHPHIGRNACIERNTHTNINPTVELIHKSLKDISVPVEPKVPNFEENCFSVARMTSRIPIQQNSVSEIRSYQRPIEYVPNDVTACNSERAPKQTNILQVKTEKPKWGIKKFFEKFGKNKLETEVKLAENSQKIMTSIVDKVNNDRPLNLNVNKGPFNFEGPCLSPPNRTLSPTMMRESDSKVFGFKELPTDDRTQNQIFAVIVPKAQPADFLELKSKKGSSDSLNKRSVNASMSSQSILKSNSESEDSTIKKRLSSENRITNSACSSRASINLELQYIDSQENYNISPFDVNSDCSSSEDEHLMLLSENGGSKITMQAIPKPDDKKYQNEVLKEASVVKTDFSFNKFQNKYTNFDNEFSDPNDKENVNGYSGDNPVYLAALNGEIDTELKYNPPKSPKPNLKNLCIKRQHSLEHVSEIFSSSGDVNLLNPAGRVKTPGDLPVAVRRARRDRALQKGRASESNRLSLYDDRMMFGNSL